MKMHEGKALQLFKGVVSHSVLAAAGYGGRFFSPPLHVWTHLLPAWTSMRACMHVKENAQGP